MPRYLKTAGRCACGEAVPVRRLKDLERARCSHCAEVVRLIRLALWTNDEAARVRRAAPAVDRANVTGAELMPYLRASALALEASALVSEALGRGPRGYSPALLRQWLAWARRKAEWGSKMAANVAPLLEAARSTYAHGLKVLPGDVCEQAPGGEHEPPALRLVGPEDVS